MPIVRDTIGKDLSKKASKMVNVPKQAYKFWRNITPKDTGNAKRKTVLRKNTIKAGYKYASYLDKGHSKQAPQGMLKPTRAFLTRLLRQILRK